MVNVLVLATGMVWGMMGFSASFLLTYNFPESVFADAPPVGIGDYGISDTGGTGTGGSGGTGINVDNTTGQMSTCQGGGCQFSDNPVGQEAAQQLSDHIADTIQDNTPNS